MIASFYYIKYISITSTPFLSQLPPNPFTYKKRDETARYPEPSVCLTGVFDTGATREIGESPPMRLSVNNPFQPRSNSPKNCLDNCNTTAINKPAKTNTTSATQALPTTEPIAPPAPELALSDSLPVAAITGNDNIEQTSINDNNDAWGLDGDDTITQTNTNANNQAIGDEGLDTITQNNTKGRNTLWGGMGNDILKQLNKGGINEAVAGEGDDNVTQENECSQNTAWGGDGDDLITQQGNGNRNVACGGDGHDFIQTLGNNNNVALSGGKGCDLIFVNGDNNTGIIDAGADDDIIALKGNNNRLAINGGEGHDTIVLDGNCEDWNVFNLFGLVSFAMNASTGEFYKIHNAEEVIFAGDNTSKSLTEPSFFGFNNFFGGFGYNNNSNPRSQSSSGFLSAWSNWR